MFQLMGWYFFNFIFRPFAAGADPSALMHLEITGGIFRVMKALRIMQSSPEMPAIKRYGHVYRLNLDRMVE
jgi:hypothetical protein